ncbi:MAG: hypothetical protein IEMM0002_1118 [bacterium]|nr:MAG: hypothetical protein IEMM0002_1118 [bacterium]
MWLTIKEVCRIYKIKKSTLYVWANTGKIPCYKVNGLLRFKKEEIDEWLSNHKVTQPGIEKISSKVATCPDKDYNPLHGETRPYQTLRKGG